MARTLLVATCDTRRIRLRQYDGEGDARKSIGVESDI